MEQRSENPGRASGCKPHNLLPIRNPGVQLQLAHQRQLPLWTSRVSILLVEDDLQLSDAVQQLLDLEGYSVSPAGTGNERLPMH